VSEAAGQQVFTSSKAGKSDSAGKPASSRESQVAPSEGTAVSDAWSGFDATASGSSAPAAASLGEEGSGSSTLGLAVLGLGLVGMLGAFALAVPRRRRVKASEQ